MKLALGYQKDKQKVSNCFVFCHFQSFWSKVGKLLLLWEWLCLSKLCLSQTCFVIDMEWCWNKQTRKPYWRESICTVDLRVLSSLYWLLFILQTYFTFFTKQATRMRRSTVLSLPLQLIFLIIKSPFKTSLLYLLGLWGWVAKIKVRLKYS